MTLPNCSMCRRVLRAGILLAVSFVPLLASCSTGPDAIVSYVTPDGPQYFVRTMRFRGDSFRVPLDITLLAEVPDRPVQVNITLPLDIVSSLEEVAFHTDGAVFPVYGLDRFYADADTARYGGQLSRAHFDRLRAYPDRPVLVVTSGAGAVDFTAPNEWLPRMATLNRMLD